MDPVMNDGNFRNMKILRLVQEVRIIAICETVLDGDGNTGEEALILDSTSRPIPVPYSEEP